MSRWQTWAQITHKHFVKAWSGKVSCGSDPDPLHKGKREGSGLGLQVGSLGLVQLRGAMADLCSLINYALAANEIENVELPL